MDIDQKLEFVDFGADVLTENDVIDTVSCISDKLVTAEAVFNALTELSLSFSSQIKTSDGKLVDLSDYIAQTYMLKTELSSVDQLREEFQKYQEKGNYLTAHQSLSDYYTKAETSQKFLSAHQSLSAYYKRTQLSNKCQLADEFSKHPYYSDVVLLSSIDGTLALSSISDLNLDSFQKKGNYVTEAAFNAAIRALADASDRFALKSDVSTATEIDESFYKKTDIDQNFYTRDAIEEKFAHQSDLSAIKDIETQVNYKADISSVEAIASSLNETNSSLNETNAVVSRKLDSTIAEQLSTQFYTKDVLSTASEIDKAFYSKDYQDSVFATKNELSAAEVSSVKSMLSTKADVSTIEDLSTKFYLKSETSSAIEISNAFDNIEIDTSEFVKKSDVSDLVQQEITRRIDMSSLTQEIFIDVSRFNSLECLPDQNPRYYINLMSSLVQILKTNVKQKYQEIFFDLSCSDNQTIEYYIATVSSMVNALKSLNTK